MRAIRRARSLAVVLLSAFAGTTCRDADRPTGLGRLAPTNAALAFISEMPVDQGEPVIPIRSARVRLFRLPGQTPEKATLDTVIPFGETESERTLSVGLTLTMVSERFGLELSLLDDGAQVMYHARDTVVAYAAGAPPRVQPIRLRYAGPDTAIARLVLAPSDTTIAIGDAVSLRPTAFLRDGRPSSARFGFVVHGSSSITVDAAGTLRATAPVPRGSTWVVMRIATGLADSIPISAIVPAKSLSLNAATFRTTVGGRVTLSAIARDSQGAALVGHQLVWSSSNHGVATVSDGVVTGTGVGTVAIVARAEHASATALVVVGSTAASRVVPSATELSLDVGRTASLSVATLDAFGGVIPDRIATWTIEDPSIATVSTSATLATLPVVVRARRTGTTAAIVTVDGMRTRVPVEVTRGPAARITINQQFATLLVGDDLSLQAEVRDSTGGVQFGRTIAWRSLAPTISAVGATGGVRPLAAGNAEIVASVDGVADTMTVTARKVTSLTISLVSMVVNANHGEVATYGVIASDQAGAFIANASPRWMLTGSATLLDPFGTSARVILQPGGKAVLTAVFGGVAVNLPIQGSAGPVVKTAPVPAPEPAPVPAPVPAHPGH